MGPWGWIVQNVGLRFGGPGNAVGDNVANPDPFSILGRLKALETSLVAVSVNTDPGPAAGSVYVHKTGAVETGTLDQVPITNATTVPAGEAPQDIEYTVPAGYTFYLSQITVDLRNKIANNTFTVRLFRDGVLFRSTTVDQQGFNAGDRTYVPPVPAVAGTVITCTVQSSTNSTQIAAVTFAGTEVPD